MARDETLREKVKPTSTGTPVSIDGFAEEQLTPEEVFKKRVREMVQNDAIYDVPQYVKDHSELTTQPYADYVVTRAEWAKNELTNARRRINGKEPMPSIKDTYKLVHMHYAQIELTDLIKRYSPSQRSNGNCHGEPKRSCHKARSGVLGVVYPQ